MRHDRATKDGVLTQDRMPAAAVTGIRPPQVGGWARAWIILALGVAATNATLFAYSVSIPLVANDGWYFLDTFIREYFNYTLDIRDFFLKRDGSDHAQPIQKLVLLFHLRNFGLDFTVEALIGVLFALIACVSAMRVAWRTTAAAGDAGWRAHLGFAACMGAIPLLLFSLNSPEVFSWSLVTLGYLMVALAIGYFALGAAVLTGRLRGWQMLPASFLLAVALDDLGIIYLLAFVIVCALVASAGGGGKRSLRVALAAVAGTLLYDGIVQPLLSPATAAAPQLTAGVFAFLTEHWTDVWKAAWLPASSMFIHPGQLDAAGPALRALSVALPLLCIGLHGLFWIRLPARLRERRATDLVCAGLLLSFYGTTAALVLARVPDFGFDYLTQPRYCVAYLLGSLPILISGTPIWREWRRSGRLDRVHAGAVLALAIGISVAQWPLSMNSWARYKYIAEYTQIAALQIGQLRDAPATTTVCADILYVCGYDVAKKRDLIGLLTLHQLNVFNRAFQLRHRLYPDLAALPAPVPAPPPAAAAQQTP